MVSLFWMQKETHKFRKRNQAQNWFHVRFPWGDNNSKKGTYFRRFMLIKFIRQTKKGFQFPGNHQNLIPFFLLLEIHIVSAQARQSIKLLSIISIFFNLKKIIHLWIMLHWKTKKEKDENKIIKMRKSKVQKLIILILTPTIRPCKRREFTRISTIYNEKSINRRQENNELRIKKITQTVDFKSLQNSRICAVHDWDHSYQN